MAGQIIKKADNKFMVRIFLGRDATGKRNYFNKLVHGTKKDAQKYLTAKQREKDLGVFVEPAAISFNDYLDRWLANAAKPRLRPQTFEDYAGKLDRYIRPEIGKKKLCDVQPIDIQRLYIEMQERGLSARTVRYTHAILSSTLKQAVKWRLLSQNPASLVELPRQIHKEMHALTAEDAGRLLKAAKADKWGLVFTIALTTGMRPEEYLGLQWKDVDFEKGTFAVQRALVHNRKGGGWSFNEPKTARSRRSIPISATVARELQAHRRKQAEERLKAGPAYENFDLVFATAEGTPILQRNLQRRHFKPILERAGLPANVRLYDLRHTCATLLLSANEHPKVVSERLGHASITLTLDTYSHVLPSMQQGASDKLEAILFDKTGIFQR